jgi:polysaccharide pyruvyl transferase WcaK-like protein
VITFPRRSRRRPGWQGGRDLLTLVVGGYGYRNAGDEAILAGLLQLIGHDGVTVVSRMPAETATRHGVRSVSVLGAIAALRTHDRVVIGGGGLFGRDMGWLGRALPVFGLVAVALGREVALIGVEIDEDLDPISASLVRALSRRASSVVVRDDWSEALLALHHIDAHVQPDLSALVRPASRHEGLELLRGAGFEPARRPVVGLCLTAVNRQLADRVETAILGLVDALPDVDFILIPMSRHPFVETHNDEVFARRLAERRPRLRILDPVDDPGRLLAVFEALSGAVCMRYHSLLFAERAGIPFVPIAYALKCRRWLGEHGLETAEPTLDALLLGLRGIRRGLARVSA